ncbi:LysR family transcriptional regulator [Patulibacter sp. SYSU D01012]|uniref:LysR family transcriptional regulator n=1 Tax=Patulibacter sp. SYSU D01012 TaxID=2817381 RepID=UPI001B31445A|nr:LysR family transcriptional regulator [Patulibacter sp. SYSU D01012]
MNLRSLRYFLAVVEEGSFTLAATRLGVTQGTVSTAVRRLEEDLGSELLVRAPRRRVTPTEAGRALVAQARTLLVAADDALVAVRAAGEAMRGTVRFGMLGQRDGIDLAGVMTAFRAKHPGVRPAYFEAGADWAGLIRLVQEQRLDFAVSVSLREAPDGVVFHELARRPTRCIVREGHPRLTRDAVTADDLRHEEFVASAAGTPNRADLDFMFRLLDISPAIAYEATPLTVVAGLVRGSDAVALLPAFMASAFGPGLRALLVRPEMPVVREVLVVSDSRPLSPPARAFLADLAAAKGLALDPDAV